MKNQTLYKYRSIEPFKNLVDTLLKRRLYAAPYFDLNDPMEGQYLVSPTGKIDEYMREYLEGAKKKLRICSLSRKPDIELMWAHYADGNRGVVLGVQVDRSKYKVIPVNYDGPLKVSVNMLNPTPPEEILSRKLRAWEYEHEERVFIEGAHFVNIELKEILVGSRMSTQDFSLLSSLVEKVCPEVPLVRT